MKVVELHPAHVWDCDECGRENFCRGVVVELSEEDKEAMIVQEGGVPEDWATGNWLTAPELVRCVHCGIEFRTRDFNEE